MNDKLVTVVVPIYNVEKYLKKCVDTIINQTYQNLEIILVDDGSTDSSGKIADDYQVIDKRISVIHKENGGLSDARNAGMKIATGDYVCFIDSDDYVELDMIENAMKMITPQNLNVVIWGFYVDTEDDNGNLTKRSEHVLNQNVVDIDKNINEIEIDLNFLNHLGYAWNKLYNLNFLKKYNFEFEKGLSAIEDGEFNTRVFQKIDKFGIISKAFNHYIQRNRETLGNKKYDNILDLNIRSCNGTKNLLNVWKIDKNKTENLLCQQYLLISKGYIKDIVINEKLYNVKKIEKIEKLLNIPEIKKAFKNKKIQSKKNKIYSFLVLNHWICFLKLYYKYIN